MQKSSRADRSPAQVLECGLAALDVSLSATQTQQLLDYIALLVDWNRRHNLVGVSDPVRLVTYHLLDSLTLTRYLKPDRSLIDVGTGAGLPGLVLAIARPDMSLSLMDSRARKIRFVSYVCTRLKLDNVRPLHQRLEDFPVSEKYTYVTSRAFAPLESFILQCSHLCHPQGEMLAMLSTPPDHTFSLHKRLLSVEATQVPGVDRPRHIARIAAPSEA